MKYLTPEEEMAMESFGQDPIVTDVEPSIEALYDDEGSTLRDAIGAAGVGIGSFALYKSYYQPFGTFYPDLFAIALLSGGGGLSLLRNDMARKVGRGVLIGGILFAIADLLNLVKGEVAR